MNDRKDKEQPFIFVDDYGELLAQVNDMELVEYKEKGSYQGEYYAILKAPATDDVCKIPERLYYYFGYYGSCSGCDWLESEDEKNYGAGDTDTDKRYKIRYTAALEYAQQSKPVFITPATVKLKIEAKDDWDEFEYKGAALNEEGEANEPKQPLIKDEEIRKAVRAWAEALGQREQFLCIKSGTRLEISDGSPHLLYISFWADKLTLDSIDDRTYYSIAELCGEGEV